jgi:broad specificity phosphatase PhoE
MVWIPSGRGIFGGMAVRVESKCPANLTDDLNVPMCLLYGTAPLRVLCRSAQEVTDRIDNLIAEIREIHRGNMHGEKHCDVVLVAHGHLLRAFTKRWLGYPMEFPLSLMLDPGAVGVLRYVFPLGSPGCICYDELS